MARNELISLGLVVAGPTHVYAINTMIKEMGLEHWARTSRASIYNALARLERDGHVKVEVRQVGNTPPRKVYAITRSGRKKLHDEQLEALLCEADQDSTFNLALTFLHGMPAAEVMELCARRLMALDVQRVHLKEKIQEHRTHDIHNVVILLKAAVEHVQVEMKATTRLVELLQKDPGFYDRQLEHLQEWVKQHS